MIDYTKPIMVVMDIDGTQIREDEEEKNFSVEDFAEIKELRGKLEALAQQGVVIVHATNRMTNLYAKDHGRLLAVPHYVSCSASTEVLKVDRATGMMEPDAAYAAKVAACHFDATRCGQQADEYSTQLYRHGAEHQTERKVSYLFHPKTPVEERHKIHHELQDKQQPGTRVFMVEDPKTHIIDFLPEICTKLAGIQHIADMEGVPLNNIIVMGNSNNDIAMCVSEFNCVAVGNSRPSLQDHIAKLKAENQDQERFVVAPEANAKGVMWGLRHFGLDKS